MGYGFYNGLNYINGPVDSTWFPIKLAPLPKTTKKPPKNKKKCFSNSVEVHKYRCSWNMNHAKLLGGKAVYK